MYQKITFLMIGLVSFWGCKSKSPVEQYLSSTSPDSIIIGTYMMEPKDTNSVWLVFNNIADSRITHTGEHSGESVYHAKINALRRISGEQLPRHPITDQPDEVIIEFYRLWAMKKGYLNK